MSQYKESVKNYEKIRSFMREFYVYGFKSRDEYNEKSARSYDDVRRRIESLMGEYTGFRRTPSGKNVFISLDSRLSLHNPFYKTLKAGSFTDGDITLHFILFDILHSPAVKLSLNEITEEIDGYLKDFPEPLVLDETTVRKKLDEYNRLGIIEKEKSGKRVLYSRKNDGEVPEMRAMLNFFSEAAPCGVIGSFLLDKWEKRDEFFNFKHHYITSAVDSSVTAALFTAMRNKSIITVTNVSRRRAEAKRIRIIPLRLFISVQNGRQHLLAYQAEYNIIKAFRVDYLSDVKEEEPSPRFDELREKLDEMQKRMWGVSLNRRGFDDNKLHHIEFTVKIEDGEEYMISRLQREKRIGFVDKTGERTYRFTADVYDSAELIPWIRTFICRIDSLYISDKATENQFKEDIEEMLRMYNI